MADDNTKPRQAISNAIVTQLKTITNADSATWFDDNTVKDYVTFNQKGSPSAFVVPIAVDSEYSTNLSNERLYRFRIVFYDVYKGKGLENTYSTIRQLEDDIIALFDNDYTLGGLSLGANYTLIDTLAVPSTWGREIVGEVEYLVASVDVNVKINFDIT